MLLEKGDVLCERGNTLLVNEENMVAWLSVAGDDRLEVSWCPGNYPAINVQAVNMSDKQLAEHVNKKLGGWTVRKCNIEGVLTDKDNCVVQT